MSSPSGSASTHSSASTADSDARMSSSVGARGRGQREVLAQGSDEDVVLLGHQGDVAAQLVEGQLHQSDAAHGHLAGAGRVDAGQQPAQR